MAVDLRVRVEARWNSVARRIAILEAAATADQKVSIGLATADIDQVQRWLGQQHFTQWSQAEKLLEMVEANVTDLEEQWLVRHRSD